MFRSKIILFRNILQFHKNRLFHETDPLPKELSKMYSYTHQDIGHVKFLV